MILRNYKRTRRIDLYDNMLTIAIIVVMTAVTLKTLVIGDLFGLFVLTLDVCVCVCVRVCVCLGGGGGRVFP